jgi:hypothetical protein
MSVAEKAVDDLQAIITTKGVDPANLTRIAYLMRERGWDTVTPQNVVMVAQDLGFRVVGTHIYGEAK